MANQQNLKPFTKGDPRINRKGRPKSFDALRELAQQIAHEPVIIGNKKYTVTETILRQWAQSRNPQLQRAFIEIAYGKVPDSVNVNMVQELKGYTGVSPDDWDKDQEHEP